MAKRRKSSRSKGTGTEKYATVTLFEGLSTEEIRDLLEIGEDLEVSEGEVVVEEGETGSGLFIIAAGAFDVRKKGRRARLARLEEMSHFGDMSLVADRPHAASVVCAADGRLKRLPADAFRHLLDEDDLTAYKVVRNLSRTLAERLAKTSDLV